VYRFRVTCETAEQRSLSNESRGIMGFNGVKGLRDIDTFNGVFMLQGPPQPGQPFKFSVGESCDRIKEEFNFLQAQYHRYSFFSYLQTCRFQSIEDLRTFNHINSNMNKRHDQDHERISSLSAVGDINIYTISFLN